MLLEILNHQNAKVFHAKSWIFFKTQKFFHYKKIIKQVRNLKLLSLILINYNKFGVFFFFDATNTTKIFQSFETVVDAD